MSREYQKVNANDGAVWNPTVTAENHKLFDPNNKENNTMEGYLVESKTGVGKFNQNVYKVHEVLPDGTFGEMYSIWGNTVLNGTLSGMPLGTFVCIVYEGWKPKKDMQNKPITDKTAYQSYSVFTDPNALNYREAMGGTMSAPANNRQQTTTSASSAQLAEQAATAPARSRQPAKPANSIDPFDDSDLPF